MMENCREDLVFHHQNLLDSPKEIFNIRQAPTPGNLQKINLILWKKTTCMLQKLIQIHNNLAQISVQGEDTIRMAEALVGLRQLINELKTTEQKEVSE